LSAHCAFVLARVGGWKKMIETFLAETEKKGATLMTANISAENEELVSTFKTFGFERTGLVYSMSKKL